MNKDNNNTYFGKVRTSKTLKNKLVNEIFSNVSNKYDIMNDLMSGGIHRIWKDVFVMHMDNPNAKLLDVAGGTCDIAKRFYEFGKLNDGSFDITVCDLNYNMLSEGVDKLANQGINGIKYVNAKAEMLPFRSEIFDYYSVAFGIRNFGDINSSIKEAKRVLKKGGKFICLEFSKPKNIFLQKAYNMYSHLLIPNLGTLAGDRKSYQYLVDSIEKFPNQENFANMIVKAGFKNVSYRNLSGGIVAIHIAYK